MNKKIMKILICTLIILTAVGAVSAAEQNSTDELMSVDQADEISVMEDNEVISLSENNTDVLGAECDGDAISVSENDRDVLGGESDNVVIHASESNCEVLDAEDNNVVISVSENDSKVLGAKSNSDVISVSNDKDLVSYSPFAKEPAMTQSETQYKTLYLGKFTFLNKYKKMALYGYKIPSKKNKKAWKKHKTYQRVYKKQLKKIMKRTNRLVGKLLNNHWHGNGGIYYNVKNKGWYFHILFYADFYRTYKYNPLLNKGWWDDE